MHIFPLLVSIFINLWVWKILLLNIFVFIILIVAAFFGYATISSKNLKIKTLFLASILLLLFLQQKTTKISNLSELSNDEIRQRDMRLSEYPLIHLTIGNWTYWPPLAYNLEGRKEILMIRKIEDNLFQLLDVNNYYFASHPRQRVGIKEFEKFPYIFLPFFITGIVVLYQKKKNYFLFSGFLLPLAFQSYIGLDNSMGEFSLFPFMSIASAVGLSSVLELIRKNKRKRFYYLILSLVFILVAIQIYLYEVS